MIIHVLEIVGNSTLNFVSEGLLGYKMNSCPGIGVNEGEAHKFEAPLHSRSTS